MNINPKAFSNIPMMDGIIFRNLQGVDDADAIYQIRAGCVKQDQVDLLAASEGLPSREEIQNRLAKVVSDGLCNLHLLVEVNHQAAGYGLIDSWYEEDGRWVYLILGWVLPAFRGQGIGSAMLHWGELTAREDAAKNHPHELFEFAGNASSTQPESKALLINEGYYVGYTVLEMDLDFSLIPPKYPLHSDFEIRPVLKDHYPQIATCMGEAYKNEYPSHRFQSPFNLEETISNLSTERQNPKLWHIAWYGDTVVGIVLPLVEKGRAIMYDISVQPAWRRQGIARALLCAALWDLRERGNRLIRLNTVSEFQTRACDLYRSVGFQVVKEFPRYRKSS